MKSKTTEAEHEFFFLQSRYDKGESGLNLYLNLNGAYRLPARSLPRPRAHISDNQDINFRHYRALSAWNEINITRAQTLSLVHFITISRHLWLLENRC